MKQFKGVLYFMPEDKPCYLISEGKILGKGVWMRSSGMVFKVKFKSQKQHNYAKVMSQYHNCLMAYGKLDGDIIYLEQFRQPPSRRSKANNLHRMRERKELESLGADKVLTGKHRSHETYIPPEIRALCLKIEKKGEDVKPKIKKAKQRNEVDEFEIQKRMEKRRNDYEAFVTVNALLKRDSYRMAMAEVGMSYNEIEAVIQGMKVCQSLANYQSK